MTVSYVIGQCYVASKVTSRLNVSQLSICSSSFKNHSGIVNNCQFQSANNKEKIVIFAKEHRNKHTYTHTHTHTHARMHKHTHTHSVYVCVCVQEKENHLVALFSLSY